MQSRNVFLKRAEFITSNVLHEALVGSKNLLGFLLHEHCLYILFFLKHSILNIKQSIHWS